MMGDFANATLAKSCALFVATLASSWTSIAHDAHTIISPVATLLSAIFCLLNMVTWIEARYQRKRQEDVSKALAVSGKEEEEKKQQLKKKK
jgi:hypothetical protein